ncbi:hypothetical protein WR164_01780 [Philodulcilactobacillus myokoensis]|uniref:Restriction endonuclease n=1 Tax=Philodulcilactobacillus myokoensis TaxID=2929573 RepID=A0A9W6B136_9LACO|nr:restriction endonuclease FokI C-terminal domain-containing protein [Philodulcilactobacillus myokoensis]GLB46199.1 hypothetical protein WR164_01780 [Philodulcilactobacillus myokoensis]
MKLENTISINEYNNIPKSTSGLGQDVSQNLNDVVKVPSLFVKNSNIYKMLINGKLRESTLGLGSPKIIFDKLKKALLNNNKISKENLITIKSKYGREKYASGLIRLLFKGQKSPNIIDWAASNYLSLAVGMGLIDFNYNDNCYHITKNGEKAVNLLDSKNNKKLKEFMLKRLFEYPYAAWLIRLVNKQPKKLFTKFELGDNFGFIDEPGFISLPEDMYVSALLQAKGEGNKKRIKEIRQNSESTSDKYMRWIAGLMVKYDLLTKEYKKFSTYYNKKKIEIKIPAYKCTILGKSALNNVNGGSSHKRSIKRIKWDYLASKVDNADRRKTERALIIKYLAENKSLSSYDLTSKINKVSPSIKMTSSKVADDIKGLNRIGIEIIDKNNKYILKDNVFNFVIPVKKNYTFTSSRAENLINTISPKINKLSHQYFKAIYIAFKNSTSNKENELFEMLSTKLLTKEIGYKGMHIGGINAPDGFSYNNNIGWIIDSKAYHKGFTLTKKHTDAMGRYIGQYRNRNDDSIWWKNIPNNLKESYFVYVSSSFKGDYKNQLINFEKRNSMEGGLLEITKLILLVELFKNNKIDDNELKGYILDKNINFKNYYNKLIYIK